MTTEPVLQAAQVSVHLTAPIRRRPTLAPELISGVDLSLGAGEQLALIGASGSGKSVLAAALTGALARTLSRSGTVQVGGQTIEAHQALGRGASADVVLVRQDSATSLHPLVPIGSQLDLPLRRRGLDGRAARAEAHDLLDTVGLAHPDRVLASVSGRLSGGERQRVCLALALARRPRLIVADEPTTALDVVTQADVLAALRAVGDRCGSALILVTHDLAAAAWCARTAVMDQGQLVEVGATDELLRSPRHPATAQIVAAALGSSPALGSSTAS